MMIRSKKLNRSDDNLLVFEKRIENFLSSTHPIVNIFKSLNRGMVINTEENINQVFNNLIEKL